MCVTLNLAKPLKAEEFEMNRFESAVLTLTLFFCASLSVMAQNTQADKFKVGILRADGTLIPFAEYRYGIWWNPWAEIQTVEGGEITPKSLGNQPEPWFQQTKEKSTNWYFWSSINIPFTLKPQKLLQIDNHSQRNWAVMTDYPRKQAGSNDAHNYLGIALDTNLKINGTTEIEKGGKEANEIFRFVEPIFVDAENMEINRLLADPNYKEFAGGFPASNDQRARFKLVVKKLWRSNQASFDGTNVYYIVIEREYGKPAGSRDFGCNNVAFFKGWLLKDKKGTLSLVNEEFALDDCDGKGKGRLVMLLSTMTLNNRTFLFTVEHGWEDESYVIYELKDDGITRLLETFGG
jgi:hypothetical protein